MIPGVVYSHLSKYVSVINASFTHLEVIFFVNCYSWAEDVSHDNHVGLLVVDRDAVHAHVLWQEGIGMPFNYVLQNEYQHIKQFT